jgi:predicted permease
MGPVVPEDLYRVGDMSVDGRVLLFTLVVTLVTPVFFGLAPALTAARTDLNSSLKEGGRGGWGMRSMRLRRALVVFEVAMAVVVIGGMGLMIRSFLAVRGVDLGFAANEVLVTEVTPARAAYPDASSIDAYFDRAREGLAALPGVQTVGLTAVLPLNHELWNVQFARPGQAPAAPEDWPVAMQFQVSGDYFDAMRIPLLAGRRFMESDGPNTPTVVMVSQEFADAHWAGGNPVGQPLLFGDARDPQEATVIGVVGDVKHDGIEQTSAVQIYRSIQQTQPRRRFIVLNAGGDPTLLTGAVRQTLNALDPNLPMSIRPMTAVVQENTLQWSLSSALFAVLGAAALLLASLGIYGVIAYSVAQRRAEIGLRMALGATSDRVRRGFVVEGLRLSFTGLAIGIALTLAAGQAMASVLFGVTPFDPVTLGGVLILFAGVAVLASVVPALRASRVDPLTALRYQ